jgi:hypothetical protein
MRAYILDANCSGGTAARLSYLVRGKSSDAV